MANGEAMYRMRLKRTAALLIEQKDNGGPMPTGAELLRFVQAYGWQRKVSVSSCVGILAEHHDALTCRYVIWWVSMTMTCLSSVRPARY